MRVQLYHQFFLGSDTPGGSRWNQFTKYLSEQDDIIFDVLAGNINNKTGKRIGKNLLYNKEKISNKISVYRPWTYHGLNKNFLGRLIGYFSYTLSSFFVALFLKKPDIVIISSPSIFIGFSALLISKIKHADLIFEVRDLWPESAITTGVLKNKFLINLLYRLERALYKQSSYIVPLTPAFKKDIAYRFPNFENKLKVITNGADLDILYPTEKDNFVRNKLNWKNKFILMYIGAHGLANDLFQILNVSELFHNTPNVEFVLVGDGMLKPKLKEYAIQKQLKNISFIDSVPKDQVVHYLNAADVCLATLQPNETFKTVYPNKLFDYMCCKKPIISTIDGIARDLIEQANCGFFAKPDNIQDFKEKIDQLLYLNEEDLSTLGENGYSFVISNFDRKKITSSYAKLIKNLCHV